MRFVERDSRKQHLRRGIRDRQSGLQCCWVGLAARMESMMNYSSESIVVLNDLVSAWRVQCRRLGHASLASRMGPVMNYSSERIVVLNYLVSARRVQCCRLGRASSASRWGRETRAENYFCCRRYLVVAPAFLVLVHSEGEHLLTAPLSRPPGKEPPVVGDTPDSEINRQTKRQT